MKEEIGLNDYNGRPILEGDILEDAVPSKGIVKKHNGRYIATSDFNGLDINKVHPEAIDYLSEDLIYYNRMIVIGNSHDNPGVKEVTLMTQEEKQAIFEKAMEEASKVFGCDPAYFGEEGEKEVERQLKKLRYSVEDFK